MVKHTILGSLFRLFIGEKRMYPRYKMLSSGNCILRTSIFNILQTTRVYHREGYICFALQKKPQHQQDAETVRFYLC